MAIAPVSGSPAQRTEPAKGVSMDFRPKEKKETIVEQENKANNSMKPGIDNNKEDLKGVKKVEEEV
jgi:hypothetical protein